MSYLILQIWIFLLLAALIGLIAGWLLRGSPKGKVNKVNQEWSQRYANVEAQRDELTRKSEDLNTASVRQGEMYLKLSEERDVLSRRLAERDNGSEADQLKVNEYRQRLGQHEVEVDQLKDQLSETANQLTETQQSLHEARGQAETGSLQLQTESQQLNQITSKLGDSEKALIERDQTIDQLHQKLSVNLIDLNETKDGLSKSLDAEREKAQTATKALEEARRQKEEYEEQLRCSENSLQEVTTELKQKQEFFEVNRRELDTKLKNSGQQFESVNTSIRQKDEQLQKLQQQLEAREGTLKSGADKEVGLQQTVDSLNQKLEHTQSELTASKQRQTSAENELRASQIKVKQLEGQGSSPQPPRDYSGVASGIMAGAAGTAGAAAIASKSAGSSLSSSSSSGWSKLSGMAKTGYQKVKDKVEDTTSEVVTASAKASPDDEYYRIEVIRSIGTDNRRLLHDMGVNTTLNLLDKCQDPEGIKLISKTLGRESWVVSSWASIADLLRVKGIDGSMAEVLELSGVYSVQSLADANPEKLLQSIKAVNERVDKLGSIPDIAAIASWIRHAGSLDEVIA